jgi:hypothetical protein
MPMSSSPVETDAIKRMIDPTGSSVWRRQVAHETAGFITKQLLNVPRTAIVEVHTKYPEELDRYREIAKECRVPLVNVLLTAPYEVCRDRALARVIPGISYEVDEEMLRSYYCNLEPRPDDLVFHTDQITVSGIVGSIINRAFALDNSHVQSPECSDQLQPVS